MADIFKLFHDSCFVRFTLWLFCSTCSDQNRFSALLGQACCLVTTFFIHWLLVSGLKWFCQCIYSAFAYLQLSLLSCILSPTAPVAVSKNIIQTSSIWDHSVCVHLAHFRLVFCVCKFESSERKWVKEQSWKVSVSWTSINTYMSFSPLLLAPARSPSAWVQQGRLNVVHRHAVNDHHQIFCLVTETQERE